MIKAFACFLFLLPMFGCSPTTPPPGPPPPISGDLAGAPDLAMPAIPAMASVTPDRMSRSSPTTMMIFGMHMESVIPAAVWTFGVCKVASSLGAAASDSQYNLTVTPAANAAVGDDCDLRLRQPGVDQVLLHAFTTGL